VVCLLFKTSQLIDKVDSYDFGLPMEPSKMVYKKQNSFIEIHHNKTLQDVVPRLKKLRENLSALSLSSVQNNLLQSALDEILGNGAIREGYPPFTLHAFNIAEIEKLSEEELPRYLLYRYRYETFPERYQLDEFPPCIQIEPTSICNYRCPFCYQIDEEFTKKSNGMMGMMTLELFKQIIDQSEEKCEAITLASRGEPLICPDIEAMLRYAGGKFLALKLNTNAWFLDERICYAILESGVNTVVFSADAASEPSYSRLRVNGELQRVYKNIEQFRDIRERHFPDSLIVTRVSGVKVVGTDELEDMEKFWGELVDQVAFVKYSSWENTYEQPVNKIETPCSDLWRRMFVWWNGDINPCDVDFKSHLSIGNISSKNLSRLWQSPKYRALRESHQNQKRLHCEPCNRCTFI
jgi:radical SAM protein with 4Fe4S-binding SPASM domain